MEKHIKTQHIYIVWPLMKKCPDKFRLHTSDNRLSTQISPQMIDRADYIVIKWGRSDWISLRLYIHSEQQREKEPFIHKSEERNMLIKNHKKPHKSQTHSL